MSVDFLSLFIYQLPETTSSSPPTLGVLPTDYVLEYREVLIKYMHDRKSLELNKLNILNFESKSDLIIPEILQFTTDIQIYSAIVVF